MSHTRYYLWIISMVITLTLLGTGCPPSRTTPAATVTSDNSHSSEGANNANRVQLTGSSLQNAGILLQTVTEGGFGPRLEVPATIEADPQQVSRMGARAPGRVVALSVSMGAHVNVGDPLFELATIELHQVTTEYLVAIARSRQAEDALRRARAMAQEHVGPVADLRRAEADSAAARATLHEAEEHLHFLGLRERDISRIRASSSHGQARSIIRSPMEGTVTAINAAIGQVLQGNEEVVVISRIDRVWANLHLYERDITRVRVGARVTVQLSGMIESAAPTGTLSFVSQMLDPSTHTGEGRVLLENSQGVLRPGMTATGYIELPTEPHQVWIAQQAVQSHEGHSIVFVPSETEDAGETREFEARTVSVGEERGGRVPVLEGLRVGESVVVQGAFVLRGELERGELAEDE